MKNGHGQGCGWHWLCERPPGYKSQRLSNAGLWAGGSAQVPVDMITLWIYKQCSGLTIHIDKNSTLSEKSLQHICVCQSSLRSVLEKIPHYNLTGAVLLWEGTAAARSWSWGAKKLALKKQVSKSTRLSKRQAGGRAWRAKKLALNKRKVSKSTRLSKNQFTSREPELRPQKVGSEKAGLIIMHLTNKQNKRKIQTNKQGGRAKSWLWKKGSSLERDGLDS